MIISGATWGPAVKLTLLTVLVIGVQSVREKKFNNEHYSL
jgi:hypothetical protein